jgi:hypothetical protein
LRNQSAVIGRLHPLHAVDGEAVVPLLHPGEEAGVRILCDERARAGADVLTLRRVRKPGNQVAQRLALQERVGVDRDDDRGRHAREHGIEREVLARTRFEDAPVAQAESPRRGSGDLRGAIRRVVVGQDDVHFARVGQARNPLEGRPDRGFLVPGSDHDRHGRTVRERRELAIARNQEGEGHEPDHETRDVAEEQGDHPSHDRADRVVEVRAPRPGDPDAEPHPGGRQARRDGETHRWPQSNTWLGTGG